MGVMQYCIIWGIPPVLTI